MEPTVQVEILYDILIYIIQMLSRSIYIYIYNLQLHGLSVCVYLYTHTYTYTHTNMSVYAYIHMGPSTPMSRNSIEQQSKIMIHCGPSSVGFQICQGTFAEL